MAKQSRALRSIELCDRASNLFVKREKPRFAPLEVPGLKQFFPNGLHRGITAEINGKRSSGRSSTCLHILAQATARGEVCAVIDLQDSFHPASAWAAGVLLQRIVWIRCRGNPEYAMRAADLLLHAGGFGVVLLDLCEARPRILNRIPLSYWFRFQRAIENTPTILLVCADAPQAKSCSSSSLELKSKAFHWSGTARFCALQKVESNAATRKIATIRPEPLLFQTVA